MRTNLDNYQISVFQSFVGSASELQGQLNDDC